MHAHTHTHTHIPHEHNTHTHTHTQVFGLRLRMVSWMDCRRKGTQMQMYILLMAPYPPAHRASGELRLPPALQEWCPG